MKNDPHKTIDILPRCIRTVLHDFAGTQNKEIWFWMDGNTPKFSTAGNPSKDGLGYRIERSALFSNGLLDEESVRGFTREIFNFLKGER